MEDKPQVRGMVRSIIDLARNLGLKVTAEGIETQAQADILRSQRCDYIQGYLSGRPTPARDLAAVIMTRFAESLRQKLPAETEPEEKPVVADLRFQF